MPKLRLCICSNDLSRLCKREPICLLLLSALDLDGGHKHQWMKTERRRIDQGELPFY